MPTLKLHYDGWLLLPAGLRRALGLNSGDRLATELVDSALILRPVSKSRHPEAREEAEASVSVAAETLPLAADAADAAPVRRKPGRPLTGPPRRGQPPHRDRRR